MRNFIVVLIYTLIFCYNVKISLASSPATFQENTPHNRTIIFNESLLYTYISKPCIIFLAPSSTGKTTLISKIKDKNNLANFVFSGFDQVIRELNHDFRNYSDIIQGVFRHVNGELLKDSLLQNKGLVIDTITADPFIKAIWLSCIRCPIHVFSLYLSPEILVERIKKRNSDCIDAPEKNFRSFIPFNQYVDIFKKTNQVTKLKLNRSEIIKANAFDDMLNMAKRTPIKWRTQCVALVQRDTQFQKRFFLHLLDLFENKVESIHLKPTIPFSYAINISAYSSLAIDIKQWMQYLG